MNRIVIFITTTAALLSTGCSHSLSGVDIDAAGYSNSPLSGRELLAVAKDYAVVNVYRLSSMENRIRSTQIDKLEKGRMLQQLSFLENRRSDALGLASKYYDPKYTSQADQQQVFRAAIDLLDTINREYLVLADQLRKYEDHSKPSN